MRITTVQTHLFWEDIEANLKHFSNLLQKIAPNTTDLIVLPEMFSTGFTMQTKKVSERENGIAFQWMKKLARAKNSIFTGSLIIEADNQFFNRLFWIYPDGSFQCYDKKHLFTMAGEHHHFTAGKERIFTKAINFMALPLICYDLRFPLWCRNRYEETQDNYLYDLMVVVANWPAARVDAWKTMLKARAIENQCYVVGVNRIGTDGNGIHFCGGTAIFDAKGNTLYQAKDNCQEVVTSEIDFAFLNEFRAKFPVLKDV